jgi:hypothetical protein
MLDVNNERVFEDHCFLQKRRGITAPPSRRVRNNPGKRFQKIWISKTIILEPFELSTLGIVSFSGRNSAAKKSHMNGLA